MKITILDHNYTHLENYPPSVRELLSYQTKTYNRYTKKWKISTNTVLDIANSTTYTGLVPYILENTPDVVVVDRRKFPLTNFHEPVLAKPLRGYQIDYLIRALKEKRMIIHASTGSGKTIILAAILDSLRLSTLILAPNKTILAQLHKELGQLLPHYTFGSASGEKLDMGHKVVIGLASTLVKHELKGFGVVLADEAHTVAAQQAHDVILGTNAAYRFGFSGSPTGRSDNRDLVVQGLLGPIVRLVERDELVQGGHLADMRIEFHRASWEGDYIELENVLIVNNRKRNDLIKKIVKDHKGSTIFILVRRLDHGELLQREIPHSIFISGESVLDEREEVREGIKNGTYKIIIASNILAQGFDAPAIEVGIDARGMKSTLMTIQGMGRVNRPFEGRVKKWIDIWDSYAQALEEHAKERLRIYKEQGVSIDFVNFPPGMESKLRE